MKTPPSYYAERTRAEIIAEFDRIETEGGGPALTNSGDVLRKVSANLGVAYEQAREVMLDEWTMRNSG